MDVRRLKTISGKRHRPHHRKRKLHNTGHGLPSSKWNGLQCVPRQAGREDLHQKARCLATRGHGSQRSRVTLRPVCATLPGCGKRTETGAGTLLGSSDPHGSIFCDYKACDSLNTLVSADLSSSYHSFHGWRCLCDFGTGTTCSTAGIPKVAPNLELVRRHLILRSSVPRASSSNGSVITVFNSNPSLILPSETCNMALPC